MTKIHSRRGVLKGAVAIGATLGWPCSVLAQAAYPDKSKPIRAIVPLSAGSTVDALARVYAQQMGEILGTTFVVDNRAGAESVIGIQAVKSMPADGYTVMFSSISTQLVNPHLFKQLAYDPFKDFAPLGGTMRTPLIMMAGPKFAFKSVREFVAAAKAAPEKYTYASISSTTRLSGAIFASAAGIKLLNVPYKDFGGMIGDVLENRIDVVFLDGAGLKSNTGLGMRGMAVCAKVRSASFPDVPTMEEQGVPIEVIGYHSAYVLAGTPPAALATLRDALRKAEGTKAVRDFIASTGNEIMNLHGEAFGTWERGEFDKWGKAARDSGLAGTM
jgi:tripartite-type tricarboxylate transporter receptor subunit TctC